MMVRLPSGAKGGYTTLFVKRRLVHTLSGFLRRYVVRIVRIEECFQWHVEGCAVDSKDVAPNRSRDFGWNAVFRGCCQHGVHLVWRYQGPCSRSGLTEKFPIGAASTVESVKLRALL